VTPLGRRLTKGARQIAEKKGTIHQIEVSGDATPENYILRYVGNVLVRVSDSMADLISGIKDDVRLLLADEHGKPVRETTVDELNEMSKKPRGSES